MTYSIHVKLNKSQKKKLISAFKKKQGCGIAFRRVQITDPKDDTQEIKLTAQNYNRLVKHLGSGIKSIPITVHHRGGFLWGILPAIGRIIAQVAPKIGAFAVKHGPTLLKKGAKAIGKLALSAGTTALMDKFLTPSQPVEPIPVQLPTQPEEPVPQQASGIHRRRAKTIQAHIKTKRGGSINETATLFDIGKQGFEHAKEKLKKRPSKRKTK